MSGLPDRGLLAAFDAVSLMTTVLEGLARQGVIDAAALSMFLEEQRAALPPADREKTYGQLLASLAVVLRRAENGDGVPRAGLN